MNTLRNTIIGTLLISGASLAAADITFTGTYAGRPVDITINGTDMRVFAGKLSFVDSNPGGFGAFNTVCVDLLNQISGGSSYGVTPQSSQDVGGGVELAGNLVARWFTEIGDNNNKSAGLQLAVWEALYDGGSSLESQSGNFVVRDASDPVKNWANRYYAEVNTPGNAIYLKALEGSGGQSQMMPVPEPATIGAAAIGIAALVRRARRRKLA